MNAIWKFGLTLEDAQAVMMPKGAEVLHVTAQHNHPCLWARVDTDADLEQRRFFTHGTGHQVVAKAGKHVGTYLLDGGALVFHVFEEAS